jgi:Protein of unknown function (DUF3617)
MNTRFAKVGTVPSLLALATFCAGHTLRSQTLEPPPIKMGLWQTESNGTVTGMENTPMGKAMSGQHGSVTQGCLTPDTWKNSLQKMQSQNQQNDCKVSNFHQDSHSVSFDEVCTGTRNNSNIHFNATFDDDEHMHGTVKMVMTAAALPQGMTMNMDLKSHYVSSSCGDVKPGEGKVIHAQ